MYFHQYNLYNKIFRGKLMGILRLHRKEALNVMKCCVWLAGRSGLKCNIIRLDWTTASLLEIKNNLIQLNWQILMDTNTAGSKQMTHRARWRSKQQTEWESQYTGENQDRESYIWVLTYLPATSGEHSWKKLTDETLEAKLNTMYTGQETVNINWEVWETHNESLTKNRETARVRTQRESERQREIWLRKLRNMEKRLKNYTFL